jgi:tetratricopeptide (TPR) repeat protein
MLPENSPTAPAASPIEDDPAAKLLAQGRTKEAADVYRERLRAGSADLRDINGLATASMLLKDYAEVCRLCDWSLRLAPMQADVWLFKGIALAHQDEIDEAIRHLRRARQMAPGLAPAHFQLGLKLQITGEFDEALQSLRQAVQLNPDFTGARVSTAILLADMGRIDEGLVEIDEVIRRRPDDPVGPYVKGELLLSSGDYAEGWRLFENRSRIPRHVLPVDTGAIPLWQGERLHGKRLLVHPELGFGDYLMFARFVPALLARGASVLLHTKPPLAELLQASFPTAQISTTAGSVPQADYHCPVMSLAGRLGVTAESVPAELPYLRVPPAALTRWQSKLGKRSRLRVGLVWSGRSSRMIDRTLLKRRSVPIGALAPLLEVPVEWHSLQQEVLPGERDAARAIPQLIDHSHDLKDFSDTAALAAQMDLVISTDTSVAHLAGALGRPLWMMLPFSSDYRWPRNGPSPWYPDAWLVRQQSPGDWTSVVATVAGRLRSFPE